MLRYYKSKLIKALISMIVVFATDLVKAQAPSNITLTTPAIVPVDETKRATARIYLKEGFQYGASSTGSKLILQIADYPGYVESGYSPMPNSCGINTHPINPLVGEIEGNFMVSPTGAATYQIPIKISPGTAGVQPNLSIVYTSGSGSGIMGLGWSLSGLSAISRGNKNPYLDGNYEAVNSGLNDVYNLDGNRMLLKAGTYGVAGSTYDNEITTFATISAVGSQGFGPQSFIVTDKNGTITEYGNSTDAQLVGVGDNTPIVWLINKVTDEFGNYTTYHYKQLNGETVIDKIKYTGNASAGLLPYNEIVFEYQPKTEKNTFYIAGKEFHSTQLLKSITANANNLLAKKYNFDYGFQFNTILLKVTEINQDGSELNPTEFCWNNPADNSTISGEHNTNLYYGTNQTKYNLIKQTIATDFDGDGYSDLVIVQPNNKYDVLHNKYRSNIGTLNTDDFGSVYNSANSVSSTEVLSSNSLDADFDGAQEVYTIINDISDPTKYHVQELKNLNGVYTPGAGSGIPFISVSTVATKSTLTPYNPIQLPSRFYYDKNDYTSDGIFDELIIDPDKISLNSLMGNTIYNVNSINSIARPLDFDGDGILDIIIFKDLITSLSIDVLKYNAGSFNIIHSTSVAYSGNSSINTNLLKLISLGDYNGDGKSDIVFLKESKDLLFVRYSNGQVFLNQKNISTFETLNAALDYNIISPDINGDGINDIIFTSKQTTVLPEDYITYYSIGDLFIKGFNSTGKFNYLTYEVLKFYPTLGTHKAVTETASIAINYQMTADFNGDGVFDVLSINDANTKTIINNALSSKAQYISRITSALNKQISVTYANTKTSFDNFKTYFYQNVSSGPSYALPIVSFNPGRYVVTKTSIDNTNLINLSQHTRYIYGRALFHNQGKGFLGFESFTMINTDTKIGAISSFVLNTNYFVSQTSKNLTLPFSFNTTGSFSSYNYDDLNSNSINLQKRECIITPIVGKQIFIAPSKTTQIDFLSSTASETNLTYDLTKKGSLITSLTNYGMPLVSSAIKTEQTSYSYININGIYKPQSITSTSTQQGETFYARTKEFTYDGLGHLTSTISDPTFGAQSLITSYFNFNGFGSPTKATISAGDIIPRTSETFFDATGRFITKTINPKGDIEEFEYEPKYGTLKQKKDISGLISKYYYDGLGRLIKSQLPDGTTNTVLYNWIPSSPHSTFSKTVFNEGEAYVTSFYNYLNQLTGTETVDFNGNTIITKNKYNYLTGLLEESSEPYFASATITPFLVTKYTYDLPFYRNIKTEAFKVTGGSYTSQNLFTQTTFNVPTKYYPSTGNIIYNAGFTETSDQTNKLIRKQNNQAGQVTVTKNKDASGITQTSTMQYNSNGNPKNTVLTYSSISDVITHAFTYNNLGQQTQLIDPTAGTINYQYNTIGELLQQDDPNGTYNYSYDNIGRMVTREGSTSGVTNYQYVTASAGKNQLQKIIGPQVTTEYTYDYLGRAITQKETITSTGKVFTSATDYDTYSRVSKQTHTGGFVTRYAYASTGELLTIKNNVNNLLWQRNNQNALGQITDYTYGNGINTIKTYNNLHQLIEINHGSLHKQSYFFNNLTGNLIQRDFENLITASHNREKFQYDGLDRLNQAKQTNPAAFDATLYTNNTTIDIKGNITQKDDAGTFVYSNPAKPFTLTSITGPTSLIPINTLNTTINDLHKVNQITEPVSGKEMNFLYGNDDERIKVDYLIGGTKQYTRYYQANYDYEEDATATNTKSYTYLYAPTGLLAVYCKQNTTSQLLYALTDHLGSPITLTDASQNIVHEQNFDAWGRRRNPNDWSYTVPALSGVGLGLRGFTLHEHIDEFNLINMNGRLYDPALGRFMQPDNQVQYPDNIQTFNKYCYVANNPLKYTDPSGWGFGNNGVEFSDGLSAAYSNYGDYNSAQNNSGVPWASGLGSGGNSSGWFNGVGNSNQRYNSFLQTLTPMMQGFKFERNYLYLQVWTNNSAIEGKLSNNLTTLITEIPNGYHLVKKATSNNSYFDYGNFEESANHSNSKLRFMNEHITAQSGGVGLNTANDWLGYAGFGEAGLSGVQMGMIEYRRSLSIGTFSNFSKAYRALGTTGKVLGGAANWVGAPINTLIDYNSMKKGEISGGRFSYRTTGTAVGIVVGAYVGAIPGAAIGGSFWAGEKMYDGYMQWQTQMSIYLTNLENGLKSGWVPVR